MENYSNASSYPDSGDSSPRYREIEGENAVVSWDEPPVPAAARIKLMISYGGRIQLRPSDNQFAYVNGETKILFIDRSTRFSAFQAKVASIAGADDVCVKYQLPGEELDALVSVTNDEDLEHMMLEFDRLHHHRSTVRSSPRLRVFLFPVSPPPPSAALLESRTNRQWFVDALNSVPQPPQIEVSTAASPPPPPPPQNEVITAAPPPRAGNMPSSPDYLFGLDKGFVPPPAVKVKDPVPDPPAVLETFSVEGPAKEERQIGGDPSPVVSPAVLQSQIQELQKIQIADNPQSQPAMQRNGKEEALTRTYHPPEYYFSRVQEKPPPPAPAPAPTGYLPVPRSVVPGRYASVAGGDQPVYLIHASHGVYPPSAHGFYTPMQSLHPADVYRDSVPIYAAAPGAAPPRAAAQGADSNPAYASQVAYDNTGRPVYYTGAIPAYQTVSSVGLSTTESAKPAKPSQVS
ncbi:uncharacterized protein [Typha latifolia]|uniref:uncharacterized protein n=1 Tax=Typha latifolia TaxID=4733 RepID=UPI003C2DBD55